MCDTSPGWNDARELRWRAPGSSGRAARRSQDLQDSGELTSAGMKQGPCGVLSLETRVAARQVPKSIWFTARWAQSLHSYKGGSLQNHPY